MKFHVPPSLSPIPSNDNDGAIYDGTVEMISQPQNGNAWVYSDPTAMLDHLVHSPESPQILFSMTKQSPYPINIVDGQRNSTTTQIPQPPFPLIDDICTAPHMQQPYHALGNPYDFITWQIYSNQGVLNEYDPTMHLEFQLRGITTGIDEPMSVSLGGPVMLDTEIIGSAPETQLHVPDSCSLLDPPILDPHSWTVSQALLDTKMVESVPTAKSEIHDSFGMLGLHVQDSGGHPAEQDFALNDLPQAKQMDTTLGMNSLCMQQSTASSPTNVQEQTPRKIVMHSVPRRRNQRRNAKSPAKPYKCKECGKGCERVFNLRTHMHTHDPERLKPFRCHVQGCRVQPFAREHDLRRHIGTIHEQNKLYQCGRCMFDTKRLDTLQRHQKNDCSQRRVARRATSLSDASSPGSSDGEY